MAVRLDVYSLLYGLLLGVLLLLSRRRCAAVWPFYMVLLMVVLLVQYLFCLGLPHGICWGSSLIVVVIIILWLPYLTLPMGWELTAIAQPRTNPKVRIFLKFL